MKFTPGQINKKIEAAYTAYKELNNEYSDCDVPNIEIHHNGSDRILVELYCMYESPAFNSLVIQLLCEQFGTKHINETNRFAEGGCETCDYGSSYGFTLDILLPEERRDVE